MYYQTHQGNNISYFGYSNDMYEIGEPGNAYNVITVGSYNSKNEWTDMFGGLVPDPNSPQFMSNGFPVGFTSFFSSKGPTRDGLARKKPEIYAPGAWIASSYSEQSYIRSWNSWKMASDSFHVNLGVGTSFSAPHVTGTIALMLELNHDLSVQGIKEIICEAATPAGYLDAYAAVARSHGSDEEKPEPIKPENFALLQNHPNPFNAVTQISFTVPGNDGDGYRDVTMDIFNILGQKVKILKRGKLLPGQYTVTWDSRDQKNNEVASGIYLYRLKCDDKSTTKKMLLLK